MFDVLDIGASGLQVQRTRLDTIAANIANVNTTKDADGKPNPYRRRFAVMQPGRADNPAAPGVRVAKNDPARPPRNKRHEPWNPEADAEGNVFYPNIDMAIEYVNALEASRAYEANISLLETSKAMINSTLRLI